MIFCRLLIFFRNQLFSKNYFRRYQSVKQFEPRSGPTFCWAWSGFKLFAKSVKNPCTFSSAAYNNNFLIIGICFQYSLNISTKLVPHSAYILVPIIISAISIFGRLNGWLPFGILIITELNEEIIFRYLAERSGSVGRALDWG